MLMSSVYALTLSQARIEMRDSIVRTGLRKTPPDTRLPTPNSQTLPT